MSVPGWQDLFLDFWVWGAGSLFVDASDDFQNWKPIGSYGLYGTPYSRYILDLEQGLGTNNISRGGSLYVRFSFPVPNPHNGTFRLDDVRVVAGNPNAPAVAFPSRTSSGQFQFQLSGPVGQTYVFKLPPISKPGFLSPPTSFRPRAFWSYQTRQRRITAGAFTGRSCNSPRNATNTTPTYPRKGDTPSNKGKVKGSTHSFGHQP